MAKRQKQSKRQRGRKQQPTLKKQISSKLSKLANQHLEHFENVDLLRKVGEKSNTSKLVNSLESIFSVSEEVPKDTFNSKIEDVLGKLKTLKRLIALNISNTKDKKNFNNDEYIQDRKSVVDLEFKVQSSNQSDTDDLKVMNQLYKKHKRIKQLFD